MGSTSAGTTDKAWDGSASRFTDAQYKKAAAACDPGDSPPKTACFLPHHEPSGTTNVNGVHAAAQRVSGLKGHDAAAVARAKAHLRSHYAALNEDPPDAIKATLDDIVILAAAKTKDCPTCKGTGKIRAGTTQCPDCKGKGTVPVSASTGGDHMGHVHKDGETSHNHGDRMGVHEAYSGTHTHAHTPYGEQGGDKTHEHMHKHVGDNTHRHDHNQQVPAVTAAAEPHHGPVSFTRAGPEGGSEWWQGVLDGLAFTASGKMPGPDDDVMMGAPWAIAENERGFFLIAAGPTHNLDTPTVWNLENPIASYAEAVQELANQLASEPNRPVLDQGWVSDMAYEGVDTGDGRYINPGAIQYRACPMPLMLQTTTESGHQGAVLAGAINQTGTVGQTAKGGGDFDATDAGRTFTQIIGARGQFGVSIDVAEADGEPVCADHGPLTPDSPCDYDCPISMHFSLIKIMGVTGTPFPAFEQAYIAFDTSPATQPQPAAVAASGGDVALPLGDEELGYTIDRTVSDLLARYARDETHRNLATPVEYDKGGVLPAGTGLAVNASDEPEAVLPVMIRASADMIDGIRVVTSDCPDCDPDDVLGQAVIAAGGPLEPPAEWFKDPGFHPNDGRMVRQPNGSYACPLTVDLATGEVYGHMASWTGCHTSYSNKCVTPPRSRNNYAAFNTRPVRTAEGDIVHCGHLTMGTGHAPTNVRMGLDDIKDHYDGGPGAVRMAWVHMGEDQYGPWFHGGIVPNRTPEQIAVFAACSVSGDWREVWKGKGLDCVALLAGVTVPGFPIASLAAAGVLPEAAIMELGDEQIGYDEGVIMAMVATGMVRQLEPWERYVGHEAARIDELTVRVERAEAELMVLRPIAAQQLLASAGLPDEDEGPEADNDTQPDPDALGALDDGELIVPPVDPDDPTAPAF